jgi:uncharacterized protein
VTVGALGTGIATISDPVGLDLVLQRVPEGIVVRGTITARYEAPCSTCLRPVVGTLDVEVSELFEDFPVDGETYPIAGHHIDVEQLLRDALVLELPLAPTCPAGDPECVAESAADTAADPAAGTEDPPPPTDPRWAALSQLEL